MFQGYGSEGLRLVGHEESVFSGQVVLRLTFDPVTSRDGLLTAECQLDHPFYVKNKGKGLGVRRKCVCVCVGGMERGRGRGILYQEYMCVWWGVTERGRGRGVDYVSVNM